MCLLGKGEQKKALKNAFWADRKEITKYTNIPEPDVMAIMRRISIISNVWVNGKNEKVGIPAGNSISAAFVQVRPEFFDARIGYDQ